MKATITGTIIEVLPGTGTKKDGSSWHNLTYQVLCPSPQGFELENIVTWSRDGQPVKPDPQLLQANGKGVLVDILCDIRPRPISAERADHDVRIISVTPKAKVPGAPAAEPVGAAK